MTWADYDTWRLRGPDDEGEFEDDDEETGTVDRSEAVEVFRPLALREHLPQRAPDSDSPCDDDIASL